MSLDPTIIEGLIAYKAELDPTTSVDVSASKWGVSVSYHVSVREDRVALRRAYGRPTQMHRFRAGPDSNAFYVLTWTPRARLEVRVYVTP